MSFGVYRGAGEGERNQGSAERKRRGWRARTEARGRPGLRTGESLWVLDTRPAHKEPEEAGSKDGSECPTV